MADPLVVLGVSYAGKEGVKVAAELIRDVLGPSAKALGKGIAAPIEAWATQRTERALTVVINAVEMVEAGGYKPSQSQYLAEFFGQFLKRVRLRRIWTFNGAGWHS